MPRDVYHTAAFHSYSEGSGEGAAFLGIAGDRDRGLAWPYLLRRVSEVEGLEWSDACDVTSVYGYSGPLAWGCLPGDDFLAVAWQALLGLWREQRVVSAFTRFHPLLGNAAVVEGFRSAGDDAADPPPVAPMGRTISIDLTQDEVAIRSGYSESLRRQIRSYRKAAAQTTTDDVEWKDVAEFTRLYHQTMSRNAANGYYFFDVENFLRLRDALGEHVHLILTRADGVLGAAGVFTEYGGIVQEHLMAADEALAAISPYKVQLDDVAVWARARGNRVLHLGGGRGAREDSLFEFKRRFSPRRHEFATGRWVLDRERAGELTRARRQALADRGETDTDYFPAYRAPIVAE